jgi:hypothetical protein
MSIGLVRMFPCLSLRLSSVVSSVFFKIFLCILLGCRFNMFLYLLIFFLQFIKVCFVVMFFAFIFEILPILLRIFIQSYFRIEFVGGTGMLLYFCMFVMLGWMSQFGSCVVVFIAFMVEWYIVSSFFHCFNSLFCKNPPCLVAKFVSVGTSGTLHVFSMAEEMFVTNSSIYSVCVVFRKLYFEFFHVFKEDWL